MDTTPEQEHETQSPTPPDDFSELRFELHGTSQGWAVYRYVQVLAVHVWKTTLHTQCSYTDCIMQVLRACSILTAYHARFAH